MYHCNGLNLLMHECVITDAAAGKDGANLLIKLKHFVC